MSKVTDAERRKVAESMRGCAREGCDFCYGNVLRCIDPEGWKTGFYNALYEWHPKAWNLLADLIEPSDGFDLDAIQRACFEGMEGSDEPEWTLYTTIYDAICRYKRGESGMPDAGACDRNVLLALADEVERDAEIQRHREKDGGKAHITSFDLWDYANHIREACGEEL